MKTKNWMLNGLFVIMVAMVAIGCSSTSDSVEGDNLAVESYESSSVDGTNLVGDNGNLGAASSGRGR